MKKIRHILFLIAGILITSIISYIVIKGNADSYLRVIPSDAKAIGRIDFKEFIRSSKLTTVEQLQILNNWFKNDNVTNIGLDVERPFYFFVNNKGNVGMVASVRNQNDFSHCIEEWQKEGVCSSLTYQRGYNWTIIKKNFILAFDGHKALCMGPENAGNQEVLKEQMIRLLEQNGNESAIQSLLFKELRSSTESIACVLNFDMVPISIRSMIGSYLKVHNANDLLLKLSIGTVNNEVQISSKFIPNKKEVNEQLNTIEKTFRRIDGVFLDKCIETHAAWACFNTNGDVLLQFMRLNDSVRMALVALNVILDADNAIRAIDGDVMININKQETPSALVIATISQHNFLTNMNSWIQNSKGVLHHIEGDTYAMNVGHDYLTFGVKDNYLYVHTPQAHPQILRNDMFGQGNEYLLSQSKKIKGARFYATINMKEFFKKMPLNLNQELNSILSNIERIDICMEKTTDLNFNIKCSENINISKTILLHQ